jgi:glycosyltransferase involved in cell wall biosynthesis
LVPVGPVREVVSGSPAPSYVARAGATRSAERRWLRIAIVAPPWLTVPPPAYGGTENVLDALARGLHAEGHEVTLCTVGDSTCPVPTVSVFEHAIGVGAANSVDEIRHVIHAYDRIRDVEVVHDHTLVGPLYSAAFPDLPVVTTNHGPFSVDLNDLYRVLSRRVPVIAISHHQASMAVDVPIAAVIHHGVRLGDFPIGKGGGGYAAFLGRMHPGKAPHLAAEIARTAGFPLRIAAKMREPEERAYFETMVRPLLGADVTYVGELDRQAKIELLARADCLLNPIRWPEPFGMVMIEALACGTPVITTGHGAAPEIVEDGVVGFVRQERAGLVEAIARIGEIDRSACRARVEERFSVERMVAAHLAVYRRAMSLQVAPEPALARAAASPFEVVEPGAA